VVELVDTQDLGSCAFGCEGSSPSFGTQAFLTTSHLLLGLGTICRGCRTNASLINPPASGHVPKAGEGQDSLTAWA
jgi:hypothetical protein